MTNTSKKIADGRLMQGICSQWAIDNSDLTSTEFMVYMEIVRKSFGYRQNSCLLSLNKMIVSRSTAVRTIDSLVSKRIISKHGTGKDGVQGVNRYTVLEPKVHIENFKFGTKIKKQEVIINDGFEDNDENNPWL